MAPAAVSARNLEELKQVLDKADAHVGILRRTRFFRGVGVRGSDFAPFYQAGIPCISFSSNGPTWPIISPETPSTGSIPTSWPTSPNLRF